MDNIKLILEVEKHRELYDPQHQFYEDNIEKDQCWDAVGAAVCMFPKYSLCHVMYHVSITCEKGKLRVAKRLVDWCREMRVWCASLVPVVADRSQS